MDLNSYLYFTKKEIVEASDNADHLKEELLFKLNVLRGLLGRRVKLLCLNKGNHVEDSYHYKGMAADFVLYHGDGFIDSYQVLKTALEAGFKGVGIYWNGKGHSFHVDIREDYAFWMGIKQVGESKWRYKSLFKNPKEEKL